jgi:hypothetical protein
MAWTGTMKGWASWPQICASTTNRLTSPGERQAHHFITLKARGLPNCRSRTRHTTPMPPASIRPAGS